MPFGHVIAVVIPFLQLNYTLYGHNWHTDMHLISISNHMDNGQLLPVFPYNIEYNVPSLLALAIRVVHLFYFHNLGDHSQKSSDSASDISIVTFV